jgi:hypothetical protein
MARTRQKILKIILREGRKHQDLEGWLELLGFQCSDPGTGYEWALFRNTGPSRGKRGNGVAHARKNWETMLSAEMIFRTIIRSHYQYSKTWRDAGVNEIGSLFDYF